MDFAVDFCCFLEALGLVFMISCCPVDVVPAGNRIQSKAGGAAKSRTILSL